MGDCACNVDFMERPTNGEPLFFFLELTSACNNRCPGCPNVFAATRSQNSLPIDTWKQIIEKLAPHTSFFKLTGGEPTLYPQFEHVVKYISHLDIPFTLLTNGRWHDPTRMISFLARESKLTGILVSLHGATAGSHEAFSGVPGSFAEVVANVRLAVEAGLNIATSCVLNRHNVQLIDDTIHLNRSLGVDHIVFNRYIGESNYALAPDLYEEMTALQRVTELIADWERDYFVRLGTPLPTCFSSISTSTSGCLAGEAFATVDPWGNVRPCNHAPVQVGNLLKQPFEEIWFGETMLNWRNMVPEACSSCKMLSKCHGGCKAQMILRKRKTDPLMQLNMESTRPSDSLTIEEHVYPVGDFVLHENRLGGYLLSGGSQIIPISGTTSRILSTFDGVNTVRDIKQDFGLDAVNLIANLYYNGLVRLY